MNKDSLGDRIKKYEQCYDIYLPRRMPILLRLDGKNFTSYTKGCKKPFDDSLINALNQVAIELCKEIQGAQIAYLQSDEITVLIHNYKTHDSQPWLDNRLCKILSVSASIASDILKEESVKIFGKPKRGRFDARALVIPENDVNNAFLFRQNDATRNSISMVAQSLYSHKELFRKNSKEQQEMIFQKGINWNELSTHYKRGRCIVKQTKYDKNKKCNRSFWLVDNEIPIFSKDSNYIEKYLVTEE